MAPLEGAVRVTAGQSSFLVRVLRHPNGPGKSIDVVRRPDVLRVYRGPRLPPVVNDMDPLLMFSRSQGRIRKLLRNVSGIPPPFVPHRVPRRRADMASVQRSGRRGAVEGDRRPAAGGGERDRPVVRGWGRPGMTNPPPCTRVISTSRYLPRCTAAAHSADPSSKACLT